MSPSIDPWAFPEDVSSPAWSSGYKAREEGKSTSANPYSIPHDQANFIWGWITADAEAEFYGYPTVEEESDQT
jgi:ribosome modulation factor